MKIENKEFTRALNLIKNTNESFFLTGKAGTGKSYFVKYVVENIVEKQFVVVAFTGIAAINVGGVTINSFFRFPLKPLLPNDNNIRKFDNNSEKMKIINNMDTLIIDEVSMLRSDMLSAIDYSLRKNLNKPNEPFGGKQIVLVGDVFQLEPVSIASTGEAQIIDEIYGGSYFFNAASYNSLNIQTVELQHVYRQDDIQFIELLDKIRTNSIELKDLERINSRKRNHKDLNKKEFIITLTTTNSSANETNKLKYKYYKIRRVSI